ncbi:MAG TPA: hypothetical protein DIW23_11560 [Anaerolineae bacterium]|nr:hypothetical protein [Anaerolineae bacterium]
MTLPNILTIARIVITPILFVSIYYNVYWVSISLYLLALLTDLLDGKIARSRGLTSAFGRSMDSVADKMLVMTGLMGLVLWGTTSLFLLFLFLYRELIILGVRGIRTADNSTLAEINDVLGRIRFVVLHAGILVLMIPSTNEMMHNLGIGLVLISLLMAYIVSAYYVYQHRKELKASMQPKSQKVKVKTPDIYTMMKMPSSMEVDQGEKEHQQ